MQSAALTLVKIFGFLVQLGYRMKGDKDKRIKQFHLHLVLLSIFPTLITAALLQLYILPYVPVSIDDLRIASEAVA